MRKLCLFLSVVCVSSTGLASSVYISGGRIQLALESLSELGNDPGVGGKSQSCLLCHSSAAGGPGNLNGSFGQDFRNATSRLGISATGLAATGVDSLAVVFGDSEFQSLDSDGDGVANGDEFEANSDPASDVIGVSSGGGDSGGGCGRVQNIGTFGGGGGLGALICLFLPMVLMGALRLRRAPQSSQLS